jgi:hypothetical protein
MSHLLNVVTDVKLMSLAFLVSQIIALAAAL